MNHEEQIEIFAKNLEGLIVASGKSQKEIAEDLKISPQVLNNWLKRKSMPKVGTAQAIADYFGVYITELIDEHSESGEIRKMLDVYSSLSPENRKQLLNYALFLKNGE